MIKTDVVIIGAGPVGLFAVHQLGIKGLKSEIIDKDKLIGNFKENESTKNQNPPSPNQPKSSGFRNNAGE